MGGLTPRAFFADPNPTKMPSPLTSGPALSTSSGLPGRKSAGTQSEGELIIVSCPTI